VLTWKLQALSIDNASSVLQSKGFRVGHYQAKKYFQDQRDYLYAYMNKSGLPCATEWSIILPLHENKVAEINSKVSSTCL
jgi:hypothetical protein